MRALIAGLGLLMAGGSAAAAPDAVQTITAAIPGNEAFEAPEALQDMEEGVVLLDLTIQPDFDPAIELPDGAPGSLEACGFGPVEARTVSVRTGSNHLLLEVRMGSPERHAANLLSCEYAPENITDAYLGRVTRLKGCFLAHATSIPTAVYWVLNPLPASACGFGD